MQSIKKASVEKRSGNKSQEPLYLFCVWQKDQKRVVLSACVCLGALTLISLCVCGKFICAAEHASKTQIQFTSRHVCFINSPKCLNCGLSLLASFERKFCKSKKFIPVSPAAWAVGRCVCFWFTSMWIYYY
jgi:hypothetical protein